MSTTPATPTVVGISMEFMRRKAPELARDIVCQLDGAANLAKSYGLNDVQWEVLRGWPAFRQMIQEASEELGGSAGTVERARRKAALAVSEVGITDMATLMGDPKVSARDRIAAFDQLKDIGGLGSKQQAAAASVGLPMGFGGALIQIVMPNGAQLQVGAPDDPALPAIEGESTRVETKE